MVAFKLTPKQFEVLLLLSQAKSNKEIAQILRISVRTVEAHVTNILCETNCICRTELLFLFLNSGVNSFTVRSRITKHEQIAKLVKAGISDPSVLASKVGACRTYAKSIVDKLKILQLSELI